MLYAWKLIGQSHNCQNDAKIYEKENQNEESAATVM